MMKLRRLVLIVLFLWPLAPALAQDGGTGVWVTTQDFCVLRKGPGISFEPIEILDPGVTLSAIGRSASSSWIQVDYAGQHGWLYAGWLVWNGDVVSLPVDGVDPAPFVRRALVQGITTRDAPIYQREVVASDRIGTLPEGTEIEVTGRLGYDSQGFYRLQIFYQGQLYWIGAWDVRIVAGNEHNVLDTVYMYSYGRLGTQLARDIDSSTRRLYAIQNIWTTLSAGTSVNCDGIPDYATRRATDYDVAREPTFQPLIVALDIANASINAAISRFEDACSREGYFLTVQDVNTALNDIENGRRNLNMAASLLISLQVRDPMTGSHDH